MAEIDYKEYARQMRENCVKDENGVIRVSPELWEQIAGIIENIPTADVVEVKHGYWLLDGRCSECLANSLTTHKSYCPNCGAKMDGGKAG